MKVRVALGGTIWGAPDNTSGIAPKVHFKIYINISNKVHLKMP